MAHSGLNFEMHQGEFDIHETDSVLEMLPPKPSKSIKKVTKRLSQRGKAFSKEEDRIICSAFLNIYIYCQEQTNLVEDITKGCMTTSMSTLEHLPVEVSKPSSIIG